MKSVIYAISDPRTSEIRYVGRTVNYQRRVSEHKSGRGSARSGNWIRSLLAQGIMPDFHILEDVPEREQLKEREQWWIAEGRRLGWNLTNLTDGGDGTLNPSIQHRTAIAEANRARIFSTETRQKIARASRNRKHSEATKQKCIEAARKPRKPLSPEHRAKLSEYRKGKPLSLECRAKISQGLHHRKVSEETRQKLSDVNMGKQLSEETKAKLSEAHKGKRLSPEHREKIGKSTQGKKRSPETRQRLSESVKRSWIVRKQRQINQSKRGASNP